MPAESEKLRFLCRSGCPVLFPPLPSFSNASSPGLFNLEILDQKVVVVIIEIISIRGFHHIRAGVRDQPCDAESFWRTRALNGAQVSHRPMDKTLVTGWSMSAMSCLEVANRGQLQSQQRAHGEWSVWFLRGRFVVFVGVVEVLRARAAF